MSEWQKIFDKNIRAYISLINEFLLKNEWQNVEVGSVLKKDTQKIKDAVLAKNYLKEGKFKIVSQSKDLFSGYSDDESVLNDLTKPVIIFGDHTQIVKYIDFPFVLGADGVKVLEPSDEYETQFFYYLLKAVDLNSNKYARHFSLLRKEKIPFKKNSLKLQNSIISYLSDFEKNDLSEKKYFDFETEEKIKNLHISNIKVGTLLDDFSNQQIYLTQLRQAILQEAIEGKLTADWRIKNPVQKGNPNFDATALLEQIKAEKQRLITEGKIKKDKPLATINPDDVPFALPNGWVWVRLGDLTELITSGSRDWAIYYKDEGRAKFVRMGNLSHDWFDLKNNKIQMVEPPKSEGTRTSLIENDLLISITGDIGWKALIPKDFGEGYINQHTALVRFTNLLRGKFFPIILCSPFSKKQFNAPQRGIKNSLRLGDISEHLIALPPLAEQNAIVERVDRLLESVNTLERQVTERKSYAQQLMQAVLKEAFAG